jgi:antitoxin component of RelBE/YafQ-DinJ toxin-antitoxin module
MARPLTYPVALRVRITTKDHRRLQAEARRLGLAVSDVVRLKLLQRI